LIKVYEKRDVSANPENNERKSGKNSCPDLLAGQF
jgi:hypothetical protein